MQNKLVLATSKEFGAALSGAFLRGNTGEMQSVPVQTQPSVALGANFARLMEKNVLTLRTLASAVKSRASIAW
jgi:hypothetical protein